MKYPVALLNELVDDYGAAREIVNAQARVYQEYIAQWQPRPCPPRARREVGSPAPRYASQVAGEPAPSSLPRRGVGSSGEHDGTDPVHLTRSTVIDPARWDAALLSPRSHRAVDGFLLALTLPAVAVVVVQLARGFA